VDSRQSFWHLGCHIEVPPNRRQLRLRPSPDVVSRRLESEIVLVHLRTNRIYELNRTAARLWELLEAGCDRADLQLRMRETFDVDEARLVGEIDAVLTQFEQDSLVKVE
jgi:Coenzyme PQQ synthesis protein D (PqqD)